MAMNWFRSLFSQEMSSEPWSGAWKNAPSPSVRVEGPNEGSGENSAAPSGGNRGELVENAGRRLMADAANREGDQKLANEEFVRRLGLHTPQGGWTVESIVQAQRTGLPESRTFGSMEYRPGQPMPTSGLQPYERIGAALGTVQQAQQAMIGPQQSSLDLPQANYGQFESDWLQQRLDAGSANGAKIGGMASGGGGGGKPAAEESSEDSITDQISGEERLQKGFGPKAKDFFGFGANNKFGFGR